MKLYKTAAAYHTWNCVLMETNRPTTPLSCCDPSEMRAPLPSDSQSLEPLWVSLSAHSYSSIDSCFSSPSRRGHNLPSSNSSRKPPHKQLNTSPEQLAAPRVGGSLPCRSAAAGRSGEAGSAPTWADAGTEPLQQPWTLLHGAPAQAAVRGLPCSCCTVKPWEESGLHCPPLQNQTKQSPGKQQREDPTAKISRLAYLLPPGKGAGALRAQGSPSYHLHYSQQRDKQPL